MDRLRGVALACVLALVSSQATGRPCGRLPCPTTGPTKGTSVIPGPNEFEERGDLFSSAFTELDVSGDKIAQITLPFTVNFGFGATNTIGVSENGFLMVGAPVAAARAQTQVTASGFQPVTDLSQLGDNVIAPFYANLSQPKSISGDSRLEFGDVTAQYGQADPYPDGGAYSTDDLQPAARITWYGVPVVAGADGQPIMTRTIPAVFAQVLLTDDGHGTSSFEFRYGPVDDPGQPGYGSLAGFVLGDTEVEFTGPYGPGSPTFFEFLDGHYVGQFANAVPETATWCDLLAGFAIMGGAMRLARRRKPGSASILGAHAPAI